jgi:tripartite-type tricarboxylate transporter receptor subunit TctC
MKPIRPKQVLLCATLLAGIAAPLFAAGQPYPSRPLRIIVPFSAGGASDVIARILSAKLTESLGQIVIVDNRPGVGSNIGIGLAAKAPADGYTLLVVSSAFTVNPSLFANPPYDALRDY